MEVRFSGNMATLILCVSSVIGSTSSEQPVRRVILMDAALRIAYEYLQM